MIDVIFEQEQDFVCDFTPDDQIDVSMDAQTVIDVKVNGTSVVDVKGVANVSVPTTAEEVHALPDTTPIPIVPTNVSAFNNDAGYITEDDIPPIPTEVSELLNDVGYITEDDIPPLVTDLGYIDPEPYEEDVFLYLNTLTQSGFFKFTFGGDDLTYFVAVQAFYREDDDITLVNQHYWGDEEGPITEYTRALALEGDEVIDDQTVSYMTMESASTAFASKGHTHYRTASASFSVWDFCNGSQISFMTDAPILFTDMRTPRHAWLIETTATLSSPNMRFIRLTDLHDASVIYQRSGAYSAGNITWGDWYKYGGEVFTP